ncbi:MAG: PAS domain-containing protein [Proteobacteria bacterium]|nr:PAS domain-containing protein [Pseudomonadota bacterium]
MNTPLSLQITEDRFLSLVENIPGIVYQCRLDDDWTMEYISHGVEELTGYPSKDFIGNNVRSFASIIYADDVEMVEEVVLLAVENKTHYTIEYRIVDCNGELHWVFEQGKATYDEDGQALWLDGVIFDESSRKLSEKLEVNSLRVLESLSSGADIHEVLSVLALSIEEIWPDMICSVLLLADDGKHLLHGAGPSLPQYYNDAIHGIAIGPTVGSCGTAAYTKNPCIISDITIHPNWAPFLELTSRVGVRACWSHPILSGDGSVLGTFACYYKDTRNPTASELQGIERATHLARIAIEKKCEEAALVEAKEQAERASNAKSEFLSRMSHEFRTPLNAIMGFAQLLELDDNLTEIQIGNSHEIYNAGEHLLSLVNDILDLSKIEVGKIQLSMESVALLDVIDECNRLISPLAEASGIAITLDVMQGAQDKVFADLVRLKQVLLNLVNNAIKYNCKDGLVAIRVTPAGERRVRVSIKDSGRGLSQHEQSLLFVPFERLGADNNGIEGSGVGLVITRKLVELMGGEIGVESEVGEGSVFWVEFDAGC